MKISNMHRKLSARRNSRALLHARSVPRHPRHGRFVIEIVNVGAASARAASWRIEGALVDTMGVELLMRDLPGKIEPGVELSVANVEPSHDSTDPVNVIIRWVQPSGMVDESVQRVG